MNAPSTMVSLAYSTPTLASIFPSIQWELGQILELTRSTAPHTSLHHTEHCRMLLSQIDTLATAADPALRLFLCYPTQRLSILLASAAQQATAAAAALDQHVTLPSQHPRAIALSTSLQRLQAALSDWRLAVFLESARCDIEAQIPETLH